jgi:hypothetical protein
VGNVIHSAAVMSPTVATSPVITSTLCTVDLGHMANIVEGQVSLIIRPHHPVVVQIPDLN